VILGTAAYMSPEQARGKTLDRRTDIWSFGCVLYEMLSGRPLFGGETASDTIAQILEREPDWSKLSPGVPPRVRHLLRRCLEKDPRKRLRDVGEARVELEEAIAALGSKAGAAPAAWESGPVPRRRPIAAWAVAALALAAAAFAVLWPRLFPKPAPLVRLSIAQPEGATLSGDAVMFALSPDGRSMAFAAADTSGQFQLWLRKLDDLKSVPLAGTDNAMVPFWSPDSRWIGFFADGKLKKVRLGGAVETLCDAPKTRGGSWSSSGVIVFAPAGDGPLYAVDVGGGEPRQVTTLDSTLHETAHRYPHFLPDGKHFLYSTVPFGPRGYPIRIGSIDGGPSRALMTADTGPEYADGHLIYVRNRNLVAQPFDPASMRLRGEPVTLPDMPATSPSAGYHAATVSRTGAFAYLNGSAVRTRLSWFDRSGHVIGIVPIPPGPYSTPILTGDEHKVVVSRDESFRDADLWVVDLAGGGITRLTHGPLVNNGGAVSADGRVAFETNRDGPFNIYVTPVDGSAHEVPLVQGPSSFKHPTSWSPDGRQMLFSQLSPGTGFDLWLTPTDGSGPPTPWLRTPYGEEGGWFSPDGRWILYSSDETGHYDLYVQSYPTSGRKVQVTNIGTLNGWWRGDGREIIALGTDGQTFLSIPVLETSGAFRVGPARTLFRSPPNVPGGTMTHDAQRFLLPVPIESPQEPTITVVLNWASGLR
jgi:Tol biopolymer transport system component